MHRSGRPGSSLFVAATLLASLVGACGLPLSPADLARDENHYIPARSRAQVYRATVTALRTLGYQIVVSDEASGKIKTAPKVVTATAYGNGYGAVATENAIGWIIDVTVVQGGALVHAEPRGYTGGQVVLASNMNGQYLEGLFGTLYQEIDTDVPR